MDSIFKKPKKFKLSQEQVINVRDNQDFIFTRFQPILTYEPKRKNRFIVHFPNHFNLPSWLVRATEKPKLLNNGWSEIEIILIDCVGDVSTSRNLITLYRNGILRIPFNLTVESLDPTGIVVDRWELENCSVVKLDFGQFDYSSDDILEISLTVQPTNCIFTD